MTNLIPPEAKKTVHKEYWTRVLTVWSFLLSVNLFAFSALTVPTYILFSSQLTALQNETSTIKEDTEGQYESAIETIIRTNVISKQLVKSSDAPLASVLLGAIEEVKSNSIELNTYKYNREDGIVNSVVIGGVAEDRSSLAEFEVALEESELFEKADVPLASLARDRDLPFNITVTIKNE